MTSDPDAVQQLPGRPNLAERDPEAALAVASGLRDAKAGTTRKSMPPPGSSSWLGPRPAATRRCPPPHSLWPST